MATLWIITFVAILFCIGQSHISAADPLDDLKARLSNLEASQKSALESLRSVEQEHAQDFNNITQFCQGLKNNVVAQQEAIEQIQQAMEEQGEGEGGNSRNGPCDPDNYMTIDDPRREIGEEYDGYDHLCDSNIQEGWYRFFLNGDNAVIPTYCIPERQCYTHAPTWVDLQGQSFPAVGEEVDARACSHWVGDCCNWEAPITVHNCGDYVVYNIRQLPVCHLAFCAKHED